MDQLDIDTQPIVQFMVRVKLPAASAYHSSPSGDTEYEEAYKNAIFAALPRGFEVRWPRLNERWPVDSEGYTFVPLYLSQENQEDGRLTWINAYQNLRRKFDEMKAILKDLAGRYP